MNGRKIDEVLNRSGIVFCAAGLLVALNLFIFSLPGIGAGVWPQSEVAIGALHVSGLLCALGLISVVLGKNAYIVRQIFLHPLVWLPLFIALFSLVITPFQSLPLRHFLGSVRIGEGVIWWFDWAMLAASSLFICRFRLLKTSLAVVALLSASVTYVLCLLYKVYGFPYAPYYFTDFQAITLFALIPIVTYLLHNRLKPVLMWGGLYILANILVFYTSNNGAIVYGVLGFGFFLVLWSLPFFSFVSKRKISYFAVWSVPLLVLMGSFAVLTYLGDAGYYEFSENPAIRTLISRFYLQDMLLSFLASNPLSFIFGAGWGSFTELIAGNLPLDWVDLTKTGGGQWDGLYTDHFHSHNMFMEIFSSAGLLSALAFYLLLSTLPLFTSNAQKFSSFIFAGALVSLASLWFYLPLNMPFVVLGMVFCVSGKPVSTVFRVRRFLPRASARFLLLFICVIALSIQGGGAALTLLTAYNTQDYTPQRLSVQEASSSYSCPMEYEDYGAGGLHLAKMMTGRLRFVFGEAEALVDKDDEAHAQSLKIVQRELERLNHLYCQSFLYVQEHKPSHRLLVARLLVRGELLLGLSEYLNESAVAYYTKGWKEELLSWLALAPTRSDQAVPYLLWHLMSEDEEDVKDMAVRLYALNPKDPVALWFSGLVMAGDSQNSMAGIRRMRRAIELGIERYIPVEPDVKAQLLSVPL